MRIFLIILLLPLIIPMFMAVSAVMAIYVWIHLAIDTFKTFIRGWE